MFTWKGITPSGMANVQKTSASTDVLSGTPLGTPLPPGTWVVIPGSTVNTATIAITTSTGGQLQGTGQTAQPIDLWANGVPPEDQAFDYVICTSGTDYPKIALAGTTGTCYFHVYYFAGVR